MAHAKYSPSSLELLELCPCYVSDTSRDMSAADDGTRLHKGVETKDLSVCNDEEEEEVVSRCLAYQDSVLTAMGEGSRIFNELLVKVEDLTQGTADVVIVNGTKAALIDWKFGRIPVTEASENAQMQGYTLGIFTAFPNVGEVEVHIVCPRQDVSSHATYRRTDCDAIRERIRAIIEACERDDKAPSASEKSCRFCGAKAKCPIIGQTALTVAKGLGLPMPIEFEPGRMIRPEDRAKAQVLSYILEDWGKKVREYNAKAVLEDGIDIPGFEVRSRRGSLTVVDVHTAVKLVESRFGLNIDSVLHSCSMSVPKLVDQIYASVQTSESKLTKKEARAQVEELLKEVVSETDTITFLQRKRGLSNEDIVEKCS